MPRLWLVRHGEATSGWDADPDPGLSEAGRQQAEAAATVLAPHGPLPIVVSPLRRTRETAASLATRWSVTPTVDARVAEIPSPTDDLAARGAWLRDLMGGSWPTDASDLDTWRDDIVGCLLGLDTDTVVITHFIAINVVVGRATGDSRVMCFAPANCSVTVVDHDGSHVTVAELGGTVDVAVVR